MMPEKSLKRKGIMLVVSSPSGAGKTTLTRALLQKHNDLKLSISVTTRPPRQNETDGIDYSFVGEEKFQAMINQGDFLEYAKVFNHYYGTPRQSVKDALARSEDVLFDIDWNGTQQLKKNTNDAPVTLFILPPNQESLYQRLQKRALDSKDIIDLRMKQAANEMSHFNEYDYVIINDDLPRAISQIENILIAERLRRIRYPKLGDFVTNLSHPKLL